MIEAVLNYAISGAIHHLNLASSCLMVPSSMMVHVVREIAGKRRCSASSETLFESPEVAPKEPC